MAGVKLMMLLFLRGVAVKSKMKLGFRFLSISTLNSLSALWLSSTTTTGLKARSTDITEISSSVTSFANDCKLPFSSLTLRSSFLRARRLSKLKIQSVMFSRTDDVLKPAPCKSIRLSKTFTLFAKSVFNCSRYG